MINNHDRSGWFGASDTAKIMGRWDSKAFNLWWLEKLGLRKNTFTTIPMLTGTAYEHKILEHIGVSKMDRQIKIQKYRLRVNLDGEDGNRVYEVKTYGGERFKTSGAYWMQAQVEMFASRKAVTIVAYKLMSDDYINFYNDIDHSRLSFHEIEFDRPWLESEYLPRLIHLRKCLKARCYPNENYGGKI